MKLSRLGEFGLIASIQRRTPKGRGVKIGIGDDAASVANCRAASLVTADLLLEGRHFDLRWMPFEDLGYKALAVNLSDIAAMVGIADYAILSLGIPPRLDSREIDAFYRGFQGLADECAVALIGGDTNAADQLIVSVCVIGHAAARPVRRSGARPGDDIYVTGTLGDSALGLKFLKRRARSERPRLHPRALIRRHRRPTPRLAAGALLAQNGLATAMIDVSDGLVQDLGHICQASGVGATIEADRLPLSAAYRALCAKDGIAPALSGGEDYELLFCARRKDRGRVEKLPGRAGVAVTRIGVCTAAHRKVAILDASGKALKIRAPGHDHFRR